jgi:hypothetical protein
MSSRAFRATEQVIHVHTHCFQVAVTKFPSVTIVTLSVGAGACASGGRTWAPARRVSSRAVTDSCFEFTTTLFLLYAAASNYPRKHSCR